MIRARSICAVAAVLAIVAACSLALAEPVLITSKAGAKGQGWLFGSPRDASCWIAVPRHVVETHKGGPLADFQWRDAKGREGSGVSPYEPMVGLDLAFAKASGRLDGACLSRLGGDDLSFVVARQPTVEAISMETTHVEPRRMQLRDFNGDYVRFAPANDEARREMKPGLSGSPLVLRTGGEAPDRPVGLVANVDPSQDFGHAVRFDTIKRLFLTSSKDQIETLPADPDNEFTLVNSTGVSRDQSSSAEASITDSGCWIAAPPAGARSFSIEIAPHNPGASFSGVALVFDQTCASVPDGIVLEKIQGENWTTLSGCRLSASRAHCVAAGQSIDRLRLTIIRRDGAEVGVSRIELIK